jgi:hypothetical protein
MANLRAISAKAIPTFAFVAPKPSLSGEVGERIADFIEVEVKKRGNKTQCTLTFETVDGQLGRMWVQLQYPLTSTCRYMRLVRLALGGDPKSGAPIHPKNVFDSKRFRVLVGWRTDHHDPESTKTGPKDRRDFLRVHDLVELVQP